MVIDTSGSSQEQGKGSSWYDMLIGDDNLDEFEIFDENLYIIDDGCTYCTILINWTQLWHCDTLDAFDKMAQFDKDAHDPWH